MTQLSLSSWGLSFQGLPVVLVILICLTCVLRTLVWNLRASVTGGRSTHCPFTFISRVHLGSSRTRHCTRSMTAERPATAGEKVTSMATSLCA